MTQEEQLKSERLTEKEIDVQETIQELKKKMGMQVTEEAREIPIPEVSMLQSIERNMFFDASLQAFGYIILGTAIRQHPELNDANRMICESIEASTHNENWGQYKICHATAYKCKLSAFPAYLDSAANAVAQAAEIPMKTGCLVAGTLRSHVLLDQDAYMTIQLIWIEKTEKQ